MNDRHNEKARSAAMRPAITLTALAVFVATAVLTLVTPATAEVERTVAPSLLSEKESKEKGDKDVPRTVGRHGKVLVGVVNINTATEEQLQLLPGIGPTKARRIITYRIRHGRFKRVRDLRRVKGFGYKTVKKIAAHLTVRGPTTLKIQSLWD